MYNIITYILLDPIKFAVCYALSGRAWNLVLDQRVSMTELVLEIQQNLLKKTKKYYFK